jgi:hypothetical protein
VFHLEPKPVGSSQWSLSCCKLGEHGLSCGETTYCNVFTTDRCQKLRHHQRYGCRACCCYSLNPPVLIRCVHFILLCWEGLLTGTASEFRNTKKSDAQSNSRAVLLLLSQRLMSHLFRLSSRGSLSRYHTRSRSRSRSKSRMTKKNPAMLLLVVEQ